MKKQNIINLIKYHFNGNDIAFRNESYEIAKYFENAGDASIAHYIMTLASKGNAFVPQTSEDSFFSSNFLEKASLDNCANLSLPEIILKDIKGIINAVGRLPELNKFLFFGPAGTGKTEAAKIIAKSLDRELYIVNYSQLIDSRLGQTAKNITELFRELNNFQFPNKLAVLFDEIDALALDRTNQQDVREMGRVTSTMLTQLESMDSNIVLFATTNLHQHIDKALLRRFDARVDFSRYSHDDLILVAKQILLSYLSKLDDIGRSQKLFEKILKQVDPLPFPGDLKNIIKTAVGFSDPALPFDYLKRIYLQLKNRQEINLFTLKEEKFTLREIEQLSGISKSNVARKLKEASDD